MDLYAGTPYWMVKNRLWDYYRPLRKDLRTTAVVIGAGITGALVAHELLRSGIACCMVDKRTPATGSSCASTALLQYEIDVPLCRMAKLMPEKDAVTAYRSCLEAIDELERLFAREKIDAAFRRVPSVFYASDRKGARLIREEYDIRRRHALPVDYLDRAALRRTTGIEAPCPLYNRVSAQIDTYRAATGLMKHDLRHAGLRLFSHTEIVGWERLPDGYLLTAQNGRQIRCDHAIVACGFEASPFLPMRPMRLTSTFAVASHPLDERLLRPERALVWETRAPYLYVRTDGNRIIVGGEDIPSDRAAQRSRLLPRKAARLERRFRRLYPDIPFDAELSWAGTFSSTADGLPLIGAMQDNPRMHYALGYGGNGIVFSMIAARILTRAIEGRPDPRARLFGPERPSLR